VMSAMQLRRDHGVRCSRLIRRRVFALHITKVSQGTARMS
jgi:hypothetical protein